MIINKGILIHLAGRLLLFNKVINKFGLINILWTQAFALKIAYDLVGNLLKLLQRERLPFMFNETLSTGFSAVFNLYPLLRM